MVGQAIDFNIARVSAGSNACLSFRWQQVAQRWASFALLCVSWGDADCGSVIPGKAAEERELRVPLMRHLLRLEFMDGLSYTTILGLAGPLTGWRGSVLDG